MADCRNIYKFISFSVYLQSEVNLNQKKIFYAGKMEPPSKTNNNNKNYNIERISFYLFIHL